MSSAVIKAAQKFFQSGHAYVHKKAGYVNGGNWHSWHNATSGGRHRHVPSSSVVKHHTPRLPHALALTHPLTHSLTHPLNHPLALVGLTR